MIPRAIVPLELASTRIDASTVPMHGAAHTAKAPPSSSDEPPCRARCSMPGATARSGQGSSPAKARPITTSAKPAISVCVPFVTTLAIAAAAAPRTTKTVVKPAMNGTLAATTRRPVPRSPSLATSTAETADRYPGTSGSTHGVTTETRPARKATGSFSSIEAGELFVDAALLLGRQTGGGRRRAAGAVARPHPRAEAHQHRRDADPSQRQHPGEQVEAVRRWHAQHRGTELREQRRLDPALAPAGGDPGVDVDLHLLRDRRVRLVERRVTFRADELGLHRALRRVLGARVRRRREQQREHG